MGMPADSLPEIEPSAVGRPESHPHTPIVIPDYVELDPYYDTNCTFTVSAEQARAERFHNGG